MLSWIYGSEVNFTGGTTANFNVSSTDAFMNYAKGADFTQISAALSASLDSNGMPQGNLGLGNAQTACGWADTANSYSNFVAKYTGNSSVGLNGSVTIFYSINPSGAITGLAGTSGVSNGWTTNISATSPRVAGALGDLITATSSNGGWQSFTLSTTGFGNVINAGSATANSISSLTGSGTTATIVMASPHGLPAGMTFSAGTVAGVTPSGFNNNSVTTVYTVVDTVTITYSNTTSGTASVLGTLAIGTHTIAFNNITGLSLSNPQTVYANSTNGITISGVAAGTYTPVTTGGPGTQSEARYSAGGVTLVVNTNAGTLSWSNLVICAASDETTLSTTSNQVRQTVINSFTTLGPKYIRFMDGTATPNSTQMNFAGRPTSGSLYTPGVVVPAYWGGQLTWATGDQYTAANPSFSPSSGAYVDGETVQGYVSQLPSGTFPALQLGTRGFKPIIGITCFQLTLLVGGTITNGDVLTFTFTGSYIPGSPYTKTYTVSASDTSINTLGANITTFINSDSTLSAALIEVNNAGNGQLALSYNRNAGTGSGTYNGNTISGGTTFSFTVSGGATETLTAGTIEPYTQSEGFNNFSTTIQRTYVYSKPLDCWIISPSLNGSLPIEVCCEICNRVGCGYWANVPLLYTPSAASSYGALLANTLNPGTQVVVELSNEVWNFGQFQVDMASAVASQLGFHYDYNDFYALQFVNIIAGSFLSGYLGAGGNRNNIQLTIADTILEGNGGYSGEMQTHRWEGINLVTSNSYYAAMGGPGWTSTSTSHNTAGNRPIDLADATSYAIYFCGALINDTAANSFTGGSSAQSFYNTIFQASSDYATGNPSLMAGALQAWNTDIISGTRNGSIPGDTSLQWFFEAGGPVQGWQSKVSSYDSIRQTFTSPARTAPLNVFLYEGALQQALGSNAVSGLQTADPTATLAAFTSNSYTLFPTYGASNAAVAQNLVNLYLAYKSSQECQTMIQNNYCGGVVLAHPGRLAYPAWYGYSTPTVWGFYPTNIEATPYATYNGFAAFNL